jgi:hypothetical protein
MTDEGVVRFSVASISCVACTPAFRKGLSKSRGVIGVAESPMTNGLVVRFDRSMTDEGAVKAEIVRVAEWAGFKGRVMFK